MRPSLLFSLKERECECWHVRYQRNAVLFRTMVKIALRVVRYNALLCGHYPKLDAISLSEMLGNIGGKMYNAMQCYFLTGLLGSAFWVCP